MIKEAKKKDPLLVKGYLGITPSKLGYQVRFKSEMLASFTRVVDPDSAEQHGPALGLVPTMAYNIKHIPKFMSSATIHSVLAQPQDTWPGWIAPVKGPPRSSRITGRVDITVAAATPPPAANMTIHGVVCPIQSAKFIDAPIGAKWNIANK